ncbi:very short patch repair endonuclease [Leptospirillum ferriphilum]|uniref:Very short patch repair endonuclease n=1 Tax=Leptospirillum ferriphilum (strain ML-04) TaxID=1048260 RepID=J9ZCN9_LEPFM|nr:DNA mismatch endonuclease vsr, T/G mismatch-specific endonuclease [Leptospirillum ferriphilum ML-04]
MTDVVDPFTRSRMMAGIRSVNTKPEKQIRTALHLKGFRYRLHDRRVPGCPDLVFPKYHAVLFVHGCFWHGHKCPLFRLPKTRTDFWEKKIRRNRERDNEVGEELEKQGWRKGIVWECALKGKFRIGLEETVNRIIFWVRSEQEGIEVRGTA